MTLNIRPLSFAVGAEVLDTDLAQPLDEATVAALTQALAENGILLFRKQKLTPEQHIAFAKRFGPSAPTPGVSRYLLKGYPELFVVANRDAEGNLLETRETARQWHSDHSFTAKPAIGSVLYCRQLPAVGGTTMYNNMYMAYEALSEPFRKMIDGLRAIHDVNNVKQLKNRKPRTEEEIKSTPPVSQPMVITHPVTGRKALYVSEMFTRQIEGMTEDESRPILEYLFAHSVRPEFTYRHFWQVDDVVFWDNRVVMHYAPRDYNPEDTKNWRYMLRATIDPVEKAF